MTEGNGDRRLELAAERSRPLLVWILSAATLAAELALTAPCTASPWWWTGSLGVRQRNRETLQAGTQLADYGSTEYRLRFDLNGYVFDPLIGKFKVGLDYSLSDLEISRERTSERYGLRAELELFPRSRYTPRLYFRRLLFDYSAPDPRTLVGLSLPDLSTTYGGTLRVRNGRNGGILRGTTAGFEHVDYDFLGPQRDREFRDRQFVQWDRPGRRLQTSFRLEHTEQSFGLVQLEIEDYTLNVAQRGDLTPTWRWDMTAYGILRDLRSPNAGESSTENLVLRSQLIHPMRSDDRLELRYTVSLNDSSPGSSAQGQDLTAAYRWRVGAGWEIAPFMSYGVISSRSLDARAPRGGLAVVFNRRGAAYDANVNAQVSYGRIEQEGPDLRRDSSSSAFSLSATLGHGRGARLRKQLELQLGRNELRLDTDEALADLDELTIPLSGTGTQDLYRGRATLARRGGSIPFDTWVEWRRVESAGSLQLAPFRAETVRAAAQATYRRLSARTEGGQTRTVREGTGKEILDFVAAQLSWRPVKSLRLFTHYRIDRRKTFFVPRTDADRLEGGLEWRIGQLAVLGQVWEQRQELNTEPEKVFRGFSLSIERGFAGWLPIGDGGRRRGFIR